MLETVLPSMVEGIQVNCTSLHTLWANSRLAAVHLHDAPKVAQNNAMATLLQGFLRFLLPSCVFFRASCSVPDAFLSREKDKFIDSTEISVPFGNNVSEILAGDWMIEISSLKAECSSHGARFETLPSRYLPSDRVNGIFFFFFLDTISFQERTC